MTVIVEVCIDSIQSLPIAQRAGADRIELCSSLKLGGLTPSAGTLYQAIKQAHVPIYSIIRPREGDFVYTGEEAEVMLKDIATARQAGGHGVVIGALHADGSLHLDLLDAMLKEAGGMGVTFHRAFDHCADPMTALDAILARPTIERVLTSGGATTAAQGKTQLKTWVEYTRHTSLRIMPGAGITVTNAADIIDHTGARDIHLSARTTRPSSAHTKPTVAMGEEDESGYPITDPILVKAVKQAVAHLN
ncbi:copper homeostasis protein CutC [Salinivibrio sp. ES.052]|uniref:copper homeostasis protein CutC n=1 Tax=Salinivibrio sp. ES.052 TaxID=1882823 RepID=UPI000928C5C0|nr:copper homeostasis protein CutC [Salinivibrio sp. ES.052]SIN73769.1 copper homeostasis protein [Salinivibrio sp. ES.052]